MLRPSLVCNLVPPGVWDRRAGTIRPVGVIRPVVFPLSSLLDEPPLPRSRLDNNAEDDVTPVTPLVPVRARRPPIRVTSLQDLLDAREFGRNFFLSGESQTFGPEP